MMWLIVFISVFSVCLPSSESVTVSINILKSNLSVPEDSRRMQDIIVYEKEIKLHSCCAIDLSSSSPVNCDDSFESEFNSSTSTLVLPQHLGAENKSLTFQLDIRQAPCSDSEINTVYLSWTPTDQRDVLFLKNGYLKVTDHFYHMDEYCIAGKNATVLKVNFCSQDCKGPRPCIVKCCGLDKVYSFGFTPNSQQKGCQNPGTDYFMHHLYADFINKIPNSGFQLAPHYVEKYPSSFKYECFNNKTTPLLFPKISDTIRDHTGYNFTGHPFRIRQDGKFLFREPDGNCAVVDPLTTHICIDGIINYGKDVKPFTNHEEELVMFMCSIQPKTGQEKYGGYLYGGLMIFSSIFLLMTIAVYFMLWERQTVHGWTILSHTISLFFMYIFLGTAHLLRVTDGHAVLNTGGCFAVGLLSHFFFLSTFCWLTMISVDLFLTFRAIIPRRGTKSKGLKRYTLYSVLGWGVPMIIVGVGWGISNDYADGGCTALITPAYGVQNCYLQEKALGVYLYYPIASMMFINILFFGITSVKLYMYRNSTKMATKDDTQEQFYRLFVKLFFVMGILYIFELLSWIVSGNGVFWYWAAFDVLNILRAVAVFIIFVCKSDIIWALEQNYPWLKPVLIPFACIVRNQRSFSRRQAESESVGLNSSLSTKQSTIRSSVSTNRGTINRTNE